MPPSSGLSGRPNFCLARSRRADRIRFGLGGVEGNAETASKTTLTAARELLCTPIGAGASYPGRATPPAWVTSSTSMAAPVLATGNGSPSRCATNRSRTTASSGTCTAPPWLAWTGQSIGCACRASTRPACSGRSSTPTMGGGSGSLRPRPAICGTSNTTGRKPTFWSPASCTPTASPRSKTTCRSSPGPGRMPSSSAGCGWSGVNCRWRSSAAQRSTTPGRGTPPR